MAPRLRLKGLCSTERCASGGGVSINNVERAGEAVNAMRLLNLECVRDGMPNCVSLVYFAFSEPCVSLRTQCCNASDERFFGSGRKDPGSSLFALISSPFLAVHYDQVSRITDDGCIDGWEDETGVCRYSTAMHVRDQRHAHAP